jgi:hypothetical protein
VSLPRVSPQIIDGCAAEPSASEVRIEYASLLGWLAGLVIGMSAQLQGSRRELLLAGRLGGPGDPGSRLKDSGAQSAAVQAALKAIRPPGPGYAWRPSRPVLLPG